MLDESSPLFIGLSSLSSLDLAANQIKSLSRHAFDGLDSLRHLDMTGNNISSLQDETFTQLRNLHTMSVSLCVCLSVCVSAYLSVSLSGFSGPPYISARCDIDTLGSLLLVSSEPVYTCSLQGGGQYCPWLT